LQRERAPPSSVLNRKDTDPEAGRLDNNKRPCPQQVLVLMQCTEHHRADTRRQRIAGSDLNHAGSCGMREGQQVAKVQVMSEDYTVMLSNPGQDLPIFGFLVSNLGPNVWLRFRAAGRPPAIGGKDSYR